MTKPAPKTHPSDSPADFQNSLVQWFMQNAKDYPWRRTTDPYAILVSEVMLQQTTVNAVIENNRYDLFMAQFPSAADLANASEEEILRAWEGLGYYNRVRNLQKTAREIIDNHGGTFPTTLAELQSLPGVGAYTAAAVASFAYDLGAPLVDANVARILARLYDDHTQIDSSAGQKTSWNRAAELVPCRGRKYNSALMELGQRICMAKEVLCGQCPVADFCQTQTPLELPIKKPRKKPTLVTEHALWIQRPNGSLFLQKGNETRRRGMWTLPLADPAEVHARPLLHECSYAITKYKVTLKVYQAAPSEATHMGGQWFSPGQLHDTPIPSPLRRVINQLHFF